LVVLEFVEIAVLGGSTAKKQGGRLLTGIHRWIRSPVRTLVHHERLDRPVTARIEWTRRGFNVERVGFSQLVRVPQFTNS
jgi:hypothetical protein